MKAFTLCAIVAFVFIPSSYAAYTESIAVPIEEAWQAASEVLKTQGIEHADPKKHELVSRWITDQVVRRRGIFKKIMSQEYERRYRLKMTLREKFPATEIKIRGTFEEKPVHSPLITPWSKLKPSSSEFEIERLYFMKILQQLEVSRKKHV